MHLDRECREMHKMPVNSNKLRVVVCSYADNCEIAAKLVSGISPVRCYHKKPHIFNRTACVDDCHCGMIEEDVICR